MFYLQKSFSHNPLKMTKKYCSLLTEDLQAIHWKFSLLSASV